MPSPQHGFSAKHSRSPNAAAAQATLVDDEFDDDGEFDDDDECGDEQRESPTKAPIVSDDGIYSDIDEFAVVRLPQNESKVPTGKVSAMMARFERRTAV